MDDREFRAILEESLEHVLEVMRRYGSTLPGYPTPYDVTHGYCCVFAQEVGERVIDAHAENPEVKGFSLGAHTAVHWRGRWYDGECFDGVEDPGELPFYKNGGRSREEVLAERAQRAA